jgi:hypothetical protein
MPVYFIQSGDTGPVKIGFTKDVRQRISALQTGHSAPLRLLHLFDGTETDEAALHVRFAAHRLIGEWFAPVPEVVAANVGLAPLRISDLPLDGSGRPCAETRKIIGAARRIRASFEIIERWLPQVVETKLGLRSGRASEARRRIDNSLAQIAAAIRDEPRAVDRIMQQAREPGGSVGYWTARAMRGIRATVEHHDAALNRLPSALPSASRAGTPVPAPSAYPAPVPSSGQSVVPRSNAGNHAEGEGTCSQARGSEVAPCP